jgi:hypothetical protein
VHVCDGIELGNEMEQQRRGDVVGQVADQAQPGPVAAQCAEVELERVGMMHAQFTAAVTMGAQGRNDVRVDFDDIQHPTTPAPEP